MYLPVLNVETAAYPITPPGISSLGNMSLGATTIQMPAYSDYMVDDNGQVIFFGLNGDIVASTRPDGSVEITATGQVISSTEVTIPHVAKKVMSGATMALLAVAGAGTLLLFMRR